MRYSDCLKVKESSLTLIGHPIGRKGFIPNQIWIAPKNENSMRRFINAFFSGLALSQIEPMFKNEDLRVIAVDTDLFIRTHVLFYHLIQE